MSAGADRIRFTGEFADPKLEAAYRYRHGPQDLFLGRVIIGSAAVTVLALGVLDFYLLGSGTRLHAVWAARLGFFVLSALALGLLRGSRTPAAFERRFGAWYCLTVVLYVSVGSVWPAGHVELRMTAALAVLMSYCVMPLRLPLQAAGALLHTAGALLVIGWLNPPDDPTAALGEGFWLVLINVLGAFLSYRLSARQRLLFAVLSRQSELSANLGQALAEVRTLRGMIRVCAWCRKVDNGADWQQMEAYVRDHSHAEFTHGICPACLAAVTHEAGLVAAGPTVAPQ